MRKKVNRGAPKEKAKQQSFARAAKESKLYIHQKASQLEKPGPLHNNYMVWKAKGQNLRRSGSA